MGILIEEALNIVTKDISSVSYEIVPLENAKDKISAQKVLATEILPSFNNSAMDGYGIKLSDINSKVKVIDTILAGSSKETDIQSKQAIKIMTGARVPSSVEAIVPYELVQELDDPEAIAAEE